MGNGSRVGRGWGGCKAGWAGPLVFGLALCALGVAGVRAAEIDATRLPAAAGRSVTFDADIKPIIESACLRCHGPEKPKSGYRIDRRASAIQGGEHGAAIVVGDSGRSPLIHYVAHLVEDMEMPPTGKGDRLTAEQVAVLRAWIDQGAPWSESGAFEPPKTVLEVTTGLRWIGVGGDAGAFREQWWRQEGWAGGVDRFHWQERIDDRTRFSLDGSGYLGGDDYAVRFDLQRDRVGFVRGGYSQFRSYSDDSGGYYAPFGIPPIELDRDLELDHGRVWIEVGLTPPHWPRIVAGYEYLFRDGEKATTQWGGVTDANFNTRAIYPTLKEIDEQTHVLRLDVSHELGGVSLEDNFRAEFYDLETRRSTVDFYSIGQPAPDAATTHREAADHTHVVNTLRAEKQLKDWLLVSGGYLFSQMDGGGGFSQQTVFPSDPTLDPFYGDQIQQLVLEQYSHVFNANAMVGPWQGWTGTAGVQADWTQQDAAGTALVASSLPTPYGSALDRRSVDENFAIRFDRIPFTVLYAEAQFRQERHDQFESQTVQDGFDGEQDFLRDTRATGDLKEYRAGFTVSPWTPVSLTVGYKRRLRQTDFDQAQDTDLSERPGNGYPAFLSSRDTDTDEFEARLVTRPISWLKLTLKYQLGATGYRLDTPAVVDPGGGGSWLGGSGQSADYDTHTYSLTAVLTPWKRFYTSATVSYADTRMVSAIEGVGAVVPYEGDVVSVLASAVFVVSQSLDALASYTFSTADYRQANVDAGLPLGTDYDRHGVLFTLAKRWSARVSSRLQYGYYTYDDAWAGGYNDYDAHGVFFNTTFRMP